MKITQTRCFFILLLVSLLQTSHAKNSHTCSPSACGDILSISSPFRLENDPKQCGNPDYELVCQNNATFLHLNSQKYQVKAINYHNFTIRLLDVSINNNTCSFPNHSLNQYNFNDAHGYPYSTWSYRGYTVWKFSLQVAWPINFMSCPYRLKNSSTLTETNDCGSNLSNGRHTYIEVGHMTASDVRDMCKIDVIVMTSWNFTHDKENVSVSEINDSILYGFELSWFRYPCRKCKQKSFCSILEDHKVTCGGSSYSAVTILVAVVVFLGVNIPAKIILGFTCFFGLSILWRWDYWSFGSFDLKTCNCFVSRDSWVLYCAQPCNKVNHWVYLLDGVSHLQVPKKAYVHVRCNRKLPTKRQ